MTKIKEYMLVDGELKEIEDIKEDKNDDNNELKKEEIVDDSSEEREDELVLEDETNEELVTEDAAEEKTDDEVLEFHHIPVENEDTKNGLEELRQVNKKEVIDDILFNTEKELCDNPFLYDYDVIKDGPITIEDFYLHSGTKYYLFSSLVRKHTLGPLKTRRLIRKNFDEWQAELEKYHNELKVIINSKVDYGKQKVAKKVSIISLIIVIISFIYALILENGRVWILNVSGSFRIVNTLVIFIALINMFLIVIYNRSIKRFKKTFANVNREIAIKTNDYYSLYEKNYKTTYNYYARKINRNLKADPLPFSKTNVGMKELNEIKNLINERNKRAHTLEKGENVKKVYHVLLNILIYLPFAYLIVYTIINIVTGFFRG